MYPVDPRRAIASLGLCVMAAVALASVPAVVGAADPKSAETALDKVPADAEAFGATLRLGETIATIGGSRAWKMIWNEPAIQEAWKKALTAYNEEEDWEPVRKFLSEPANKDLPALALDAISQEVFVYAGGGWGDLLNLFQEVYGIAQYAPAFQLLAGGDKEKAERARMRAVLLALSEKPERLRIPDMVIGFKVSDPAKVAAQLKRLDALVADALKETPLKGRSERVKVGDDEFLVLKLDGSLVPWDKVPLEKVEDKPNEFDKLINSLKKKKLHVSLGVRQGYLLVGFGQAANHLTKFGAPGPKLASRPEFKPLAKQAGRPITSIGYTSALLNEALATKADDIKGFAEFIKTGLKDAEIPDEDRKALDKDIDELAKEIAKGVKKPGAALDFTLRTPRGWESFSYNYCESEASESKPLTLLNHLGGDPLMAAVWRSGTTVDDYRFLAKWLSKFSKHAEKIAIAKAPNGEEIIKKYREEALPLLRELSDIVEKLWLPALADGQQAIVLDAKISSKQWQGALPPADAPLPMLELGIVLGVSDSAKLEKALESYRTFANKLLTKARGEVPAGTIPEFEIPKPKVDLQGGNTFAYYPIPEFLTIDKQFQPTGALSKRVATLTLSRNHAERLLTERPFKASSADLLNDTSRPLDSMFYFNWAGMVDAVTPWVAYAKKLGAVPDDEIEKKAWKAVDLLKVFRGYASITYREGGATITRREAIFRDIEPELKKK